MKIVIAGGSGQVGKVIACHLTARNHQVVVLSRRSLQKHPWTTVLWNGTSLGPWVSELDGADVVINLTGKSINTRYTEKNRQQILESRTQSTALIGEAIRSCQTKPRLWMNASAAGIYRHSFTETFDEQTTDFGGRGEPVPETWQFAAEVCKAWENAFWESDVPGVRKIALRTSLLLSPDPGGVFDILVQLVRKGLGGKQGNGKQFVSWMHDHDYARAVEFLIEHEEISGPVNMSAPQPVSNADFMRDIRNADGFGLGFPAPEFAIKLGALFMRTESWLVLKSVRAVPGVLQDANFEFMNPEWTPAARNLARRWKKMRGFA